MACGALGGAEGLGDAQVDILHTTYKMYMRYNGSLSYGRSSLGFSCTVLSYCLLKVHRRRTYVGSWYHESPRPRLEFSAGGYRDLKFQCKVTKRNRGKLGLHQPPIRTQQAALHIAGSRSNHGRLRTAIFVIRFPSEREIELLAEAQGELRRELRSIKADYVSADADDVIRALRKRVRELDDKVMIWDPGMTMLPKMEGGSGGQGFSRDVICTACADHAPQP